MWEQTKVTRFCRALLDFYWTKFQDIRDHMEPMKCIMLTLSLMWNCLFCSWRNSCRFYTIVQFKRWPTSIYGISYPFNWMLYWTPNCLFFVSWITDGHLKQCIIPPHLIWHCQLVRVYNKCRTKTTLRRGKPVALNDDHQRSFGLINVRQTSENTHYLNGIPTCITVYRSCLNELTCLTASPRRIDLTASLTSIIWG